MSAGAFPLRPAQAGTVGCRIGTVRSAFAGAPSMYVAGPRISRAAARGRL